LCNRRQLVRNGKSTIIIRVLGITWDAASVNTSAARQLTGWAKCNRHVFLSLWLTAVALSFQGLGALSPTACTPFVLLSDSVCTSLRAELCLPTQLSVERDSISAFSFAWTKIQKQRREDFPIKTCPKKTGDPKWGTLSSCYSTEQTLLFLTGKQ